MTILEETKDQAPTPELIDIGANLTNKQFRGQVESLLERARSKHVGTVVVTGTSVGASQAAFELTQRHPDMLVSTAGVHPHHAKDYDGQTLSALKGLLARDAVVAVGECGLDYDRDFSPRAKQRECFAAQLQLAVDLKLPVFLHERAAHDDFVAMLRDFPSLGTAVVHCFTGSASELDAYLERDLYIGLTGFICDERRGKDVLKLASRVPTGRLMIETDAPFMLPPCAPRGKGRRNEPSFLTYVVESLAAATGRSYDEIAAQTSDVAREFFRLGEKGAQ